MKKSIFMFLILFSSSLSCTVVDTELFELILEIKNQNKELLDEVKSLQAKSDSLINELKKSAEKQEEILKKVTDLQAELAKIISQIDLLNEKLTSQDADLEAIKSQLADLQKKYEGILVQLEQLQKLSQILAEIEKLKGQLSELDQKYQVVLNSLAQNQQALDALKGQVTSLQSQLAQNLEKISQLTSQLGEQGADIENILAQIEELKASCEEVKALLGNQLSGKSPVPTNGLVGWWPFNGNSIDESTTKNNAQNNGATLTEDRFGNPQKAYLFSSNFMLIPYNSKYDFQNFTVSVWIKTTQSTSSVIIKQNIYLNAQKERFGIAINDLFKNSIQLAVKYNQPNCLPGVGWEKNEIPQPIFDNKFHHIVGTVEGRTTKIYVDGKLVNILNSNYENSSLCFGGDIQVGRDWASFVKYFQGAIDDIGIWSRPLTADEISKLYQGEGF